MQGSQIYSSSISLVSNGQIIGALTTRNGKIVIVGPTDIGSGGSNGDRSNDIFNDNWFISSLTSQPPSPGITGPSNWSSIDINVIRTNTEIGFWIQNPKQTLFGDILVPYINNIRIKIPAVNSNPDVDVLNSGTYIPSGNSPIEAFVISKVKTTGYYNNFVYPDGKGSKATYVYSNSNIGNYILNDKINVNIWFENTADKNIVPNVLTVPLTAFLEAFPPSVVRDVIFANTTTTSTKISWLSPSFTSRDNNNANIVQYKVEYSSISSPNRYIYVEQTGSVPVGNTGTTNLTSLIPGTNYIATVSAQNDISTSFGLGGTGLFITANPSAPVVPSAITLTLPPSNYLKSFKSVSNNTSILDTSIYSFNANGGACNALTNFPVHSSSTIGSTGVNLMYFDFLINDNSQYRVNVNGFGAVPAFTTSVAQNNKASFSTPTIIDAGVGNTTNFYTKVSTITPSLNLNNGTPLPAGVSYTAQLRYFLSPSATINSAVNTFYIDDLSLSPSISSLELTNYFHSKKITGIDVIGATTAQNLTYTVNAKNFASYFYRSDKIISLNDATTGVTTSNSIISTLPANISSPISPDTDIQFSRTSSVVFSSANFAYGVNYNASVYSILGTNGTTATSSNVLIQKMYDGPSYNKLIRDNIPLANNTGYRVLNQSPLSIEPSPSDFKFNYDNYNNDISILNEAYQNELPIIIGKYTSANGNANTINYLNNCSIYGGVNYSPVVNETKFRYMTYVWNMNMNSTSTLTNLRFIFSGFNGNGKLSRNNSAFSINTSDMFSAYYRFEQVDSEGETIRPETQLSIPNHTSYWIDANKYGSDFVGFVNNPANNGIGGLIYSSNDVAPINTPTVDNFTYNVLMRTIKPFESGIAGIRIYFMVGMAMNSGISFEDIICSIT